MRRGISSGRAEQVSRQVWRAGFGSIGHRSDRDDSQFTSEEEQGVTRGSSDCSHLRLGTVSRTGGMCRSSSP